MPELEHTSRELLASLLHEELSPEDRERILNHLDACASCSERLDEMEPALRRHRQYRETIDRQAQQPQWPDLWEAFEGRDNLRRPIALQRPRPMAKRAIWTGAVAAGITVAALMLWPMSERSVVRADTLLQQASAISSQRPVSSRLRFQTMTSSFVRPAVLHGEPPSAAEEAIRSEFAAARYDWTDPLNPAVYSGWRDGVKRKSDQVAVIRDAQSGKPQDYTIVTTAPEEPLLKASLTLEAPSLRPVGGKFLFADQVWVEISVLPDSSAPESSEPVKTASAVPAALPSSGVPQPAAKPSASLAEREFKVRSAIDELSPSAGVPVQVEITPGDHIAVTPYGLGTDQERQLRASLSGQDGVEVRPSQPGAGPPPEGMASGNQANAAIDSGDSIAACAHLLSQFADRFPPLAEAQLKAEDRRLLWQIRRKHTTEMNSAIEKLGRELNATGVLTLEDAPGYPDAPPSMSALVEAATNVNHLVTLLYTRSEAASTRQQLAAEWRRLRQLGVQYSRSIEVSK